MKTFPTLYKKTSVGKDQEWTIGYDGNVIITRWGQCGGVIQETRDVIKTGKNLGKKNATTAQEQAALEAAAQWEKKLKKGYVKSLKEARAGGTDACIEGGVLPMLAKSYSDDGDKIVFPAAAQPKLDGHRCIAVIDDAGEATLWSRTRKRITSMPHIERDLEKLGWVGVVLDGELYNHDYRDHFEDLTSLIRPEEPKPGHEVVQYHIYDVVDADAGYGERWHMLQDRTSWPTSLVPVETLCVDDEDELMAAFEHFLAEGYEGAMVRNLLGKYKSSSSRSNDLQKIKEFKDAEFLVVGVEEGRGKLAGHAIFVCVIVVDDEPQKFRAKMKGETANLKQFWENPKLATDRMLTVKYQGLTKYGVPRFPVALRFREDL